MNKQIDYSGSKVHYSAQGEGRCLLFIHGYLESKEIWNGFINRFADDHRVIAVDIPGHGRSGVIGNMHGMDEMAKILKLILEVEQVEDVTVFGHSMGGYITMEFVSQFAEMTRGYCLFHSTCFADNEEKKQNRDREISLVLCGKKSQIIHTNIPKAFASDNLGKLHADISRAKEIALADPDEGIIALLQGMKARKDHSKAISDASIPAMIIWGKKDNYIGEPAFRKLLSLAPHASALILEDSGHMGFIEEPECSYNGIMNFLESTSGK